MALLKFFIPIAKDAGTIAKDAGTIAEIQEMKENTCVVFTFLNHLVGA